jgi:hypothetical protein
MPLSIATDAPSGKASNGWMSIGTPPSALQSRRASSIRAELRDIQMARRRPRFHWSRMMPAPSRPFPTPVPSAMKKPVR